MGHRIDITGVELQAFGRSLVAYGSLLIEAGEKTSKTNQDGIQTIHVGLKAANKLVTVLLGEFRLPDDTAIDEVIQKKIVDSGLNPAYVVKQGRKRTAREERLAKAALKYIEDARAAQLAQLVAESTKEFQNQQASQEAKLPSPKLGRKKKS